MSEHGSLKNFWLFQSGQFVSRFGSKLTSYGLILWAYAQTGSVLSTTLLTVSTIAPLFLLSFIFGSLGDTWDRKKIMLIADAVAAATSVMTLALLLVGQLQVWHLYAINLVLGISDAFQGPAVSSAQSSLVPPEKYAATSGIRSFCNAVVDIACPIIATSVYAFFGLGVLVIIDLLTFVFAAVTLLLFIEIPPVPGVPAGEKKKSALQLCGDGVRYLLGFKGMLLLLLYKAAINFSSALTRNLLTPMVLSRGGDEVQLGFVSSVTGAAMLVGSLLVTRAKPPKKRVDQMMWVMILSCVPGFAYTFGRSAWWWAFASFFGWVLIPLWMAHVDVLMRTRTPVAMHSRLFAAEETLKQGSLVLGMVLSGVLCDDVLEPMAASLSATPNAPAAQLLDALVGLTPGAGMALLFGISHVLFIVFSLVFWRFRSLRALDNAEK
ncbi:MAG: MFS transporter [Clostridia bacterium]|nr:MFS transporter [Clostridia bacterium]